MDRDTGLEGIPGSVTTSGLDKAELRRRLAAAGVRLNPLGEALIAETHFVPDARPGSFRIRCITPGDLGLVAGATYAEILARAMLQGLAVCPLELAIYLRLAWPDQPETEGADTVSQGEAPPGSLTVASEWLPGGEHGPRGFYLRRIGGEPWLRGYRAGHDHGWGTGDRFVFQVHFACP
jgi:hypothetical protein